MHRKNILLIQCLLLFLVAAQSLQTSRDQIYWQRVIEIVKMNNIFKQSVPLHFIIQRVNQNVDQTNTNNIENEFLCQSCRMLFTEAQKINYTLIFDLFALTAEAYCAHVKLYSPEVCAEGVSEYSPIVLQVLIKKFFNPDFICPILSVCPQVYQPIDIPQLIKQILADKPTGKQRPIPTFNKIYNILQLADVHTDIEYQVGGNVNCGTPECCRGVEESGQPQTPEDEAGYWGTLAKCDIPYRTVDQLISFIKKNLNIDLALWTGDNTSHDVWHQTASRNMDNTIQLTNMFKSNFQFKMIPNMGNHECFPADQFDWFGDQSNDLKVTFGDLWEDWIGKDAADQHRQNGYYSTFVQELNVRVIAMNTQVADPLNWFLIENPTDPGNFLQWLRNELYKAEQKDEKVYIIAHIPNNNLVDIWAQVYSALVDRFSYTIRGQFFGHTHSDHFMQFKSHDSLNKTVGVQFIAPSLTTHTNRNPSFRVFQVDADTMIPIDYQQYRLNLTYWNMYPNATQINWDIAYTFVKEYNLKNIYDLDQIDVLVENLSSNLKIYQKYAVNYATGNVGVPKSINPKFYCYTNALQQDYMSCLNKTNQKIQFLERLQGPWYEKLIEL